MDRRRFMNEAVAVAAVGFTAGMTVSQKADALEDEMARQLEKSRVTPGLCSIGETGEGGAPFLMGTDPLLAPMPEKPTLLDFFEHRWSNSQHLLQSANLALEAGHSETQVLACLLHDVGLRLLRTDHGYWGSALIEPYVDEEISWAIRYHQALRFFPDESVGYSYPEAYIRYFGEDYEPEPYIHAAYELARNHRWYMTSRLITVNDLYAFDPNVDVTLDKFVDVIGRHFKTPEAGLGFDNSPVAHQWRTMIWPNNFL